MKPLLVVLGTLLATCAFAADSTFHKTCSDLKLNADGSGFSAVCKKRNGQPNNTSLTLKGVQNLDGKLSIVPGGPSNYVQSCNTIRLQVPSSSMQIPHPRLTAICKKKNGHPSNTQLELDNIENVDGVLTQH